MVNMNMFNIRIWRNNICMCFLTFQLVKGNMDNKPLDVKQKELEDFYMTDPISRASSTMAKCVQAVMKQKQSKYYEAEKA